MIIKNFLLFALLPMTVLTACKQDSAPGYDIHDSKYAVTGNDGEILNIHKVITNRTRIDIR